MMRINQTHCLIAFNAIGFQVLWFICNLSTPVYSCIAAVFFIISQWIFVIPKANFLIFTLITWLIGISIDTLMCYAGLTKFPNIEFGISINLAALWLGFATTLQLSLAWIHKKPLIACLLGGIFGPLSYLAAAKLNAIQFVQNTTTLLLSYALIWAILIPALAKLAKKLPFSAIPHPSEKSHNASN